MRKEKFITRRITWYEVEMLGFNIDTSEAENRKFHVPSKFKDEKKMKDYISKTNSDENFTPVKILDIAEMSELRGMSESKFIENSIPIESRYNANEKN